MIRIIWGGGAQAPWPPPGHATVHNTYHEYFADIILYVDFYALRVGSLHQTWFQLRR
jgi:hypothetical protein